jgi:hypothetical protein
MLSDTEIEYLANKYEVQDDKFSLKGEIILIGISSIPYRIVGKMTDGQLIGYLDDTSKMRFLDESLFRKKFEPKLFTEEEKMTFIKVHKTPYLKNNYGDIYEIVGTGYKEGGCTNKDCYRVKIKGEKELSGFIEYTSIGKGKWCDWYIVPIEIKDVRVELIDGNLLIVGDEVFNNLEKFKNKWVDVTIEESKDQSY